CPVKQRKGSVVCPRRSSPSCLFNSGRSCGSSRKNPASLNGTRQNLSTSAPLTRDQTADFLSHLKEHVRSVFHLVDQPVNRHCRWTSVHVTITAGCAAVYCANILSLKAVCTR